MSDTISKEKMKTYYPSLDGLRGLAILMIILHHNFDFIPLFKRAWISLDLFFVLSGFLIVGILLKNRENSHFIRNFYIRRALRIFPIYYLSLLIFLFILPHIIKMPFSVKYFTVNQCWFWFEVQNWLFILKPEGNNNYLNHFWSLALEEQFYLLSPWLILAIKPLYRLARTVLFLLLGMFVLRILLWQFQFKDISYINLFSFTRMDGLCVGSLLAILRSSGNLDPLKRNKVLVLFLIIVMFILLPVCKFLFKFPLPYTACSIFPLIAISWALVIWFSLKTESIFYSVFNNRILVFFGKISYGLYIFHWPIDRLLRIRFENDHNQLTIAFAAFTIALFVAVFSYYAFERYFLNLKRYYD